MTSLLLTLLLMLLCLWLRRVDPLSISTQLLWLSRLLKVSQSLLAISRTSTSPPAASATAAPDAARRSANSDESRTSSALDLILVQDDDDGSVDKPPAPPRETAPSTTAIPVCLSYSVVNVEYLNASCPRFHYYSIILQYENSKILFCARKILQPREYLTGFASLSRIHLYW